MFNTPIERRRLLTEVVLTPGIALGGGTVEPLTVGHRGHAGRKSIEVGPEDK